MKRLRWMALAACLLFVSNVARGEVVESTISSNFNGTQIAAGSWIWFNANFKYTSGPQNVDVLIEIDDAYIQFTANSVDYMIPVPSAAITQSPLATLAVLDFNESTQAWENTLPFVGDDIFMTGVAWQAPVNLPGGINPVTFHARFRSNTAMVSLSWKWGAAVYTDFTDDYDTLGIQPAHDGPHAGTPGFPWRDFVVGGARGGGGSNFTGSWSGTKSVSLNQPVAVEATSWGRVKAVFE